MKGKILTGPYEGKIGFILGKDENGWTAVQLEDGKKISRLPTEIEELPEEIRRDLLSRDQRDNLLVGALEGGSNYWYWLGKKATEIIDQVTPPTEDTTFVDRLWKALDAGKIIPVHDIENGGKPIGYISLDGMRDGEILMFEKQPHHFADILSENGDATTADVWFQYVVLKDLVYG
jgi:hypothetical protein